MGYSTHLYLLLTTLLLPQAKQTADTPSAAPEPDLADVAQTMLQKALDLIESFRQQPVSPARTHLFEQQLQEELRALGRQLTQWTYNHLEPSDVQDLAQHVHFEGGPYTRLNRKTPQNVGTLFGQVRLWRVGYRPTDKSSDPTIAPAPRHLRLPVRRGGPDPATGVATLEAGARRRLGGEETP